MIRVCSRQVNEQMNKCYVILLEENVQKTEIFFENFMIFINLMCCGFSHLFTENKFFIQIASNYIRIGKLNRLNLQCICSVV